MRPKDAKHHGTTPTAHLAGLAGHEHAPAHGLESESLTSPWASDLTDGGAANWEAAWIDLGGEG
jgi:hypothetical protein